MMSSADDLFDAVIEYPDPRRQTVYAGLVGLEREKERISKLTRVLLRPNEVEDWSNRHYCRLVNLARDFAATNPLMLFAGDVGTGKTSLAESFLSRSARELKIDITLYRLSLGVRGTGAVGQMTGLITDAFTRIASAANNIARDESGPRAAVILLIDEADALAQSRDLSQMHHEDRAGVNALIRGIDRISDEGLPALVVMCSNRADSMDPAILRRAAHVFRFQRPTFEQRSTILEFGLKDLGLGHADIEHVAKVLGDSDGRDYGSTYSDLTRRFLPDVFFDAFPDGPVEPARVRSLAESFAPTPPFGGDESN